MLRSTSVEPPWLSYNEEGLYVTKARKGFTTCLDESDGRWAMGDLTIMGVASRRLPHSESARQY